MTMPDRPGKNSTKDQTVQRLSEIKDFLNRALEKLDSFRGDPRFRPLLRTDTYREYREGIKKIQFYLHNMRGYCGRKLKGQNPASELRDLANELLEMTDVLFNYNVTLSIKNPKVIKTKELRAWTLDEIKDITANIKMFGAGRILTTPLLNEIIRVGEYSYLGRRTELGPIVLSDYALDDGDVSTCFPIDQDFRVTSNHEMVHGLVAGRSQSSSVEFDPQTYHVTGPADERSGFPEFCKLSDWKILPRRSYKVDSHRHFVKIGKGIYKLEEVQRINGEDRILTYSPADARVFSRMADARFGFERGHQITPDEDYVEHATDYFFLKEKAIPYAPDKFLLNERRFRRYDKNIAMQRKLTQALGNLLGQVITIQDLRDDPTIVQRALPSESEIFAFAPKVFDATEDNAIDFSI